MTWRGRRKQQGARCAGQQGARCAGQQGATRGQQGAARGLQQGATRGAAGHDARAAAGHDAWRDAWAAAGHDARAVAGRDAQGDRARCAGCSKARRKGQQGATRGLQQGATWGSRARRAGCSRVRRAGQQSAMRQIKCNVDAAPPSPRHRMTKCQRNAITAKEKLHWLKMQDSQPDLSNRALAKLANVQPCQIREWKKLRERLEVASSCRCRLMGHGRKSKYPFIERAVYRQIVKHRAKGLAITVLDDVNDLVDDDLVVNPLYDEVPMPAEELQAAAQEDDAAEEDVEVAAAEEEGVMLKEGEEVEEPSDDEWWRPGRYDGEECEEWQAGDDSE
ncbi:unnamed protein product [Closterium sp. NIES-64]|nr:unnamed protein product [Closterium sp. NIES-64]